MSSELSFVNFAISFSKRLTEIIKRIASSEKLSSLTPEEESVLRVLHRAHRRGDIEFGNDNRNPHKVLAGEQKL
jgi:Zn-dependent oligopeptidase